MKTSTAVKNVLIGMSTLTMAGCVTSVPKAPPIGYEEFAGLTKLEKYAKRDKDFIRAKELFGESDQYVCIEMYKPFMNDPDSLEVVAKPKFDEYWSKLNYGQTYYIGAELVVFRGATFTGVIRGKNAYGGKITKSLFCHYQIKDGKLKFFKAGTDPIKSIIKRHVIN